MASSKPELVNETYTVVTLSNHNKVICKINQAFLDRDLNQQTLYYNHVKIELLVLL